MTPPAASRAQSTILASMLFGGAALIALMFVTLALIGRNAAYDAELTANAPTATPPEAIVPVIAAEFAAVEALLAVDSQSVPALDAAYAAMDRGADVMIFGPDTVRANLRALLADYPHLHEVMPFYMADRIMDLQDTHSRQTARRILAAVALEDLRSQQVLVALTLDDLVQVTYFVGIDPYVLFEEAAAWASRDSSLPDQISAHDFLLNFVARSSTP